MGSVNDNQNDNEKIWDFNPLWDSQNNFDSSFYQYNFFSREEFSNSQNNNSQNNNVSSGVIIEIKNSSNESLNNVNTQKNSWINPNKAKAINNVNEAITNKDIKTEENKKEIFFNVFRQNELRGRKSKKTQEKKRIHNKSQSDNILSKMQIKYINYIIYVANRVLEEIGSKEKFYDILHSFKKDVNSKNFLEFKKYNLGDIVSKQISSKFKKKGKEANLESYNKVKDLPVICDLLEENYFTFFNEAFCSDKRELSLKKYGLNIEIRIPGKVKMYIDLQKENKYDKEFTKNLEECLKKFYLL